MFLNSPQGLIKGWWALKRSLCACFKSRLWRCFRSQGHFRWQSTAKLVRVKKKEQWLKGLFGLPRGKQQELQETCWRKKPPCHPVNLRSKGRLSRGIILGQGWANGLRSKTYKCEKTERWLSSRIPKCTCSGSSYFIKAYTLWLWSSAAGVRTHASGLPPSFDLLRIKQFWRNTVRISFRNTRPLCHRGPTLRKIHNWSIGPMRCW